MNEQFDYFNKVSTQTIKKAMEWRFSDEKVDVEENIAKKRLCKHGKFVKFLLNTNCAYFIAKFKIGNRFLEHETINIIIEKYLSSENKPYIASEMAFLD